MSTVLYLAELVTPDIQESYDLDTFSNAGYHKVSNITRGFLANDKGVIIVSPILLSGSFLMNKGPKTHTHPESGVDIMIPRIINIYGISTINRLFLIVTTLAMVIKLVMSKQVDLVLYYNLKPSKTIPATIGSVLSDSPLILEYEDGVSNYSSNFFKLAVKLTRIITQPWLDGAICVNAPLAERAPTKNTMIFRGFPSVGLPDELPSITHENEDPIVMYAGKFDQKRGVHTFVDIVEDCDQECEFWISGWGSQKEKNKIKERLDSIGCDRVKFFGELPFQEYIRKCVQADILINPQNPKHPGSEYTFPSKILDFLSSSSVIISTNMSDLEENMSDILIIGGNNAESLSNELSDVLNSDPLTISDQKKKGEYWIENHCDLERVGRDIIYLATNK